MQKKIVRYKDSIYFPNCSEKVSYGGIYKYFFDGYNVVEIDDWNLYAFDVEAYVVRLEKMSLLGSLKYRAAGKVEQLSTSGFDVLSYDGSGTEKHIEVKATMYNEPPIFHITNAQLKMAKEKRENYYIYRLFVERLKGSKMRIHELTVFRDPYWLFKLGILQVNKSDDLHNLEPVLIDELIKNNGGNGNILRYYSSLFMGDFGLPDQ